MGQGKNWKAASSTTVGKKDLTKQSAFSAKIKGKNSEANVASANKHQVKVLGGKGKGFTGASQKDSSATGGTFKGPNGQKGAFASQSKSANTVIKGKNGNASSSSFSSSSSPFSSSSGGSGG